MYVDEILTAQNDQGVEDQPMKQGVDFEEPGGTESEECSNGCSNFQDDDLGFDPFHETQKAFEELIQEEVKNQRIHYPAFSHQNDQSLQQPHHVPPHIHHGAPSVLHSLRQPGFEHHHSPLQHPSSRVPAQLSPSTIFPRTLMPPPGFNSGVVQSSSQTSQQPLPLQQQTNNLQHWTNSIGPGSLSNHLHHPQFKPAQITLKEMEDWMSLDPAIIFSSNHLRPPAT